MRFCSVLLVVLFSFSAWALPTNPIRGPGLSVATFAQPDRTSCFRWVSEAEMNQWLKKRAPYFIALNPTDHLERRKKLKTGTYCWTSPIGAMQGGQNEVYGAYLMRIDLLPSRVFWDRNTGFYSRADGKDVARDEERGVDSDFFYANYVYNRGAWFHEYMIRNPEVIRGFTFGDQALRDEFARAYEANRAWQMGWGDYHFYMHVCPYQTFPEDASNDSFQHTPHRYYCRVYQELADERKAGLENFWQNPATIEYIRLK